MSVKLLLLLLLLLPLLLLLLPVSAVSSLDVEVESCEAFTPLFGGVGELGEVPPIAWVGVAILEGAWSEGESGVAGVCDVEGPPGGL